MSATASVALRKPSRLRPANEESALLTEAERLRLQQLRLREWAQSRASEQDEPNLDSTLAKALPSSSPWFLDEWRLTEGIELHP